VLLLELTERSETLVEELPRAFEIASSAAAIPSE